MVTIGFENENPEGAGKKCYEMMFANVNVIANSDGEWHTSGPVYRFTKLAASNGIPGSTASIVKKCLCLTWVEKCKFDHYVFGQIPVPYFGGGKWGTGKTKDEYVYWTIKYVCGPGCSTVAGYTNCKCRGSKTIKININEKTKKFTLSNGKEITLLNGYKSSVAQIVAAEAAIKLDCAKN